MVMESATMAAAANLFKGGGVVLLSASSSSSSSLFYYSRCSQSPRLGRGLGCPFSLASPHPYLNIPPTSQSLSATFCSASDKSASSVSPTTGTTTTKQEEEEEEDPTSKVKEAADLLDVRVGRILKAWRHEEADTLYVEEVDAGEPEPRIICSGLVNYIPLHLLQDARVVVLANLKPRNMRGVKSYGMLMAASDASHSNVELLVPPEGSIPGDRIWFGSQLHHEHQPPPASPNQIQKKKIWELVQPHLKTDDSCVAMLLGKHVMRTSAGVVVSTCLKNANIS